jgi:allantoin racemase
MEDGIMAIKIWWQDILPETDQFKREIPDLDTDLHQKAYENMRHGFKAVAREETQVEIHHIRHSSYFVYVPYCEMLNTVWLIEGIIEAEKQGYDAAIIGCGNDPGLIEARQAVDIPVIGVTEAAMLLACTLGHKFSLITVNQSMIPVCERNVRNTGLTSRAIPKIGVFDLGEKHLDTLYRMMVDPTIINPQFDNLCREAIAEGAEVIIPACCSLSPATSLLGYKEVPETGVPVLDVTQAAVKLAEIRVDLKRSIGLGKSQHNAYASLPAEMREFARTLTGLKGPE